MTERNNMRIFFPVLSVDPLATEVWDVNPQMGQFLCTEKMLCYVELQYP